MPRTLPRTFVATSYGPPWGGINGTGRTATGIDLTSAPQRYIVAVDPKVIPLGSSVYVWPNPFQYRGPFLAGDTGGAVKGNRIDFYDWRGRQHQLQWGRRRVQVARAGGDGATVGGAIPAAGIPLVPDPGGGIPFLPDPIDPFEGDVAPDGLPAPDLGGLLSIPADIVALFRKALLLFYPSTWWRIGKVILGVWILFWSINALSKSLFGFSPVGSAYRGAVRAGTAVATKGKSEAIGAVIGASGAGS